MATGAIPSESAQPMAASFEFGPIAQAILKPLASLRLTVVLFALSIFIIFVGTLAQVDMDMWEVIDVYFRSVVAWIDLQVFFPRTWFPSLADKVPGSFPMPGGFLIGVLMALNLLAAHLVRFKIQAKGPELLLGLAIIAVGSGVTWWVIASGHNQSGLQGEPPFSWETLWMGVRGSLLLIALASGAALAFFPKSSAMTRGGLLASAIVCGGLGIWASTTMPSPSSLRILWQLIQGGLAGVVLLIGCLLAFRKRAGIVLLHAGIGLMMFSEFFVGQYAVEGRMSLSEGETVNYLRDIRSIELAIVDKSAEETDDVTVVPGSRLMPPQRRFSLGAPPKTPLISDDQLPFDIHVEKFLKNARLVKAKPDAENYANQGVGKDFVAEEVRAASGTDGGQVDEAAAYVEFRRKGTDESLGRYLVSQWATNRDVSEEVEVDGKTYNVSLRYKRMYKDYALSLKDVRKDDYLGTNTPMNYSSDVLLTDDGQKVGDFKIWMNNPLRYAGETFYQSGYHADRTGEHTVLQVVTNTGWMMPYVGCMLVAVGMMVHFSMTLWRFLSRVSVATPSASDVKTPMWAFAVPAAIVLLFGGYVASKFRAPTDTKVNMRIHDFGKLPVVYQGRVKPLDTLARNTLRIVSNKETFDDESKRQPGKDRTPQLPAIRWMLDVISESPEADQHRVYRIDNLDVLSTLGLQRRKGFRYALSEFRDKIPELEKQLNEARAVPEEELSFYQRKLFEVERRIRAVLLLQAAFGRIFPPFPTEAEFEADREAVMERMRIIQRLVQNIGQVESQLARMQPPLAIPSDDGDWEPFATAWNKAYISRLPIGADDVNVPPATLMWDSMLNAYARGETKTFNDSLDEYQASLTADSPEIYDEEKVSFEHFFNHAQPFSYSLVLYIISFVLVAVGWVSASFDRHRVLNRSAFWLLVLTFSIHTFALLARIYISGRPPVTNLYSSAVFIGWGAVAVGLVLELIYGRGRGKDSPLSAMGIGNAVAAIAGFSTLQIAYALAADGDTFTVLQAVLDTQFWLATHVVCISIGYLTTFAAGALGFLYLVSFAWRHPQGYGKAITSMIYGTLCFAIFFSFVGTVLGGLWADDSWGRFWGWDPKENGALIIVLWNALILHARWGGMIRQKGLAMLAVMGNITTAWSWFGVNELGVGLHSYGFTEGVLRNLGLFVVSQLLILLLAGIAMSIWTEKDTAKASS